MSLLQKYLISILVVFTVIYTIVLFEAVSVDQGIIVFLYFLIALIIIAVVHSIISRFKKEYDFSTKPNVFSFISGNGIPCKNDGFPFFIEVLDDRLNFRYSSHIFYALALTSIKEAKYIYTNELNEKEKSVLARALVGGLVFGVAGAVVGGMSGMGTTKEMKNMCYLKLTTDKYGDLYFNPTENKSNSCASLINLKIKAV